MYRKILLLFIILLFLSSPIFSATIYMGSEEAYTNLQAAMSAMSAGDTLIIRDGTYTGTTNMIDANHMPPLSSVLWTTIKAEHDGGVIFDGQNVRNMFDNTPNNLTVRDCFWQFEGIIWGRTSGTGVAVTYSRYIKFLRCGNYDAGAGNVTNFSASRGSQYILFEGCYSYGTGRYKFIGYQSDHLIFRNCIARVDAVNPQGEVLAGFSMYSVSDTEVQNCIVIDSDQTAYWTNVGIIGGAFAVPSTDMDANNINIRNSIALNNELGALGTNGNNDLDAINVTFDNCVFWDSGIQSGRTENTALLRGINSIINNCTFGDSVTGTSLYTYTFNSYEYSAGKGTTTLTNNIIYEMTGGQGGCYSVENEDYNALYSNYNFYAFNTTPGAHTTDDINPITSIPYLIKVEDSSAMDGAGESGADIGANILYLIGVSGTLYGETGYATETATKMWPFPNEELIRSKMAAYTWDDGSGGEPEITGARGAMLTSISGDILNYLNPTNPIRVTDHVTNTDDVNEYIYGESGETDEVDPIVAISDSDPKTLTSGYTTILGFTSSDANGIDECKWRSGSAPDESNGTACTGTTSGTCSVTGLVQGNNSIYVGCADPSNNWGSDSITVNAPSYRAQAGGSYNAR